MPCWLTDAHEIVVYQTKTHELYATVPHMLEYDLISTITSYQLSRIILIESGEPIRDEFNQKPVCEDARSVTLTVAEVTLRVDFSAEIDFLARSI